MKERQKRAKFCPKCGSPNITFAVFFKPSIWRCLDCGYEGAFIVEESMPVEKNRGRIADSLEGWSIEVLQSLGLIAAHHMLPTS